MNQSEKIEIVSPECGEIYGYKKRGNGEMAEIEPLAPVIQFEWEWKCPSSIRIFEIFYSVDGGNHWHLATKVANHFGVPGYRSASESAILPILGPGTYLYKVVGLMDGEQVAFDVVKITVITDE